MRITKKFLAQLQQDPHSVLDTISDTDLEDIIKQFNIAYYDKQALISDELYDIVLDHYQQRSHKQIDLKNISIHATEQIPYYISSMNKLKPNTNALDKWLSTYTGPFVLSDKLDGIAGVLIKTNSQIKLYKGRAGGSHFNVSDRSFLIPYVFGDKTNMFKNINLNALPTHCVIRGEFILSKYNFNKLNSNNNNKYATARSAVTSLLNSKNIIDDIANLLEFVVYTILFPAYDAITQIKYLQSYNLSIVTHTIVDTLTNQYLSDYLNERRKHSLYDIDGIVVTDSSTSYPLLEETPNYTFAFKMIISDEIVESIVIKIIWTITKDNYIIPKVQYEPVNINNTILQYATAYHAKYIYDNKIGPGSIIQVTKSGSIIPTILSVTKSTFPQMPNIPYKWSKTNIDIIATSESNNTTIKQLLYFFKTLSISSIGEGIVSKFVEHGYNSIHKILIASESELIHIPGFKTKLIKKIYNQIFNVLKNTHLHLFMAASGCFGRNISHKRLFLITSTYPSIFLMNISTKDLYTIISQIKGIGPIFAKQFLKGIPAFVDFFLTINNIVDISYLLKSKINKSKDSLFLNQIIVFTGFRDKSLHDFITNNGGNVNDSISSLTSLLIYKSGSEHTKKYMLATKLGVHKMSDVEFKNKYKLF